MANDKQTLLEKKLYIVAYPVENEQSEGLKNYYDDRKTAKTKFFTKDYDEAGNVSFVELTIDNNTTSDLFCREYIEKRGDQPDLNIYKFNSVSTFTLVMYDSRDTDSELCKDIIERQYSESYGRNTTDWRKDGVIIYDIFTSQPVYPTFGDNETLDQFIFDPTLLNETDVDEVFLCGYVVDKELLRKFSLNKEKLFIFESNPYKINEIRSTIRNQYSGRLCMSKSLTKAMQAFSLFKDPIGNIKSTDNSALAILKDYSDCVCNNFTNFSDWERLERVKIAFDEKLQGDNKNEFVSNLIAGLFNATINVELDIDSITLEDNKTFADQVNKYPLYWTGNVLALNTDEIPTYNQVYKLVSGDVFVGDTDVLDKVGERKYDKIVTFKKNEDKFWTVNVYTAPRGLANPISIHDAAENDETGVPKRYYTPGGVTVIKVVNRDYKVSERIISVKWYNISGKRNIPVNAFDENKYGDYVFNCEERWFEKYDKTKDYANERMQIYGEKYDKYYMNGISVKRFSKTISNENIEFDYVYEDNADIDFNNFSVIDYMSNKYYCTGNKYVAEASMTDKQMYECLKTKSLV